MICNNTDVPVDVFWVNYVGAEVQYSTLAPGDSYEQCTYSDHPWIARDAASHRLLLIDGCTHACIPLDDAPVILTITD